jgi:hypothetical protein
MASWTSSWLGRTVRRVTWSTGRGGRGIGRLLASAAEPVGKQGRQAGPGGEFVVDVVELGAQRGEVVGGGRDVAAFQRPALAQTGSGGTGQVAAGRAERLVGLEDAGGEGARIDRGVQAAPAAIVAGRP